MAQITISLSEIEAGFFNRRVGKRVEVVPTYKLVTIDGLLCNCTDFRNLRISAHRIESIMNPIRKDELYENISQFLKGKGIELKEGSYTKGVHAGCSLLADAINLSQTGLDRAKVGLEKTKEGIEKKLDQVRQVIHEKTAPPKPPVTNAPPPPPANGKPKATVRAKPKIKPKRSKGKR